jgi:CII-binding regulator of phage lambda lysogenization HflD
LYYENVTRVLQRFIALLKDKEATLAANTRDGLRMDISALENSLRNKRALSPESFLRYLINYNSIEQRLKKFYNQKKLKELRAMMSGVRQRVFDLMVETLLNMAGTNSSTKASKLAERDGVEVVFAMGLGSNFKVKGHMASIELKFSRYFQNKVRALGYLCVGIQELWSSQICPKCFKLAVSEPGTNDRVKKCHHCEIYYNRDVMGGQAHAVIAKTILLREYRPRVYSEPTSDEMLPHHRTELDEWKKKQKEKMKKEEEKEKEEKRKKREKAKEEKKKKKDDENGKGSGGGGNGSGSNAREPSKRGRKRKDSEEESKPEGGKAPLKRRKGGAQVAGGGTGGGGTKTRQKFRAEVTSPNLYVSCSL